MTTDQRKELIRHWQRSNGLTVDGIAGPKTLASIDASLELEEIGDELLPPSFLDVPDDQEDPADWTEFQSPLLAHIPKDRREIVIIFGNPGPISRPDKKWRKANILSLRDLPGVSRWVDIHHLAEPTLREGLRRAMITSEVKINRCGGFVHRHIQRDSSKPLSLHSYGCAVDINPQDNRARRVPRGSAPEPWSEEWNRLYPNGVDRAFVEAMESVGFTWGGVWGRRGESFSKRAEKTSFLDPMHFEIRDR